MKVTVPLNSTLSTNSHPNDIKDPSVDGDLFDKNQSYFFNNTLTNPKKTVLPIDGYITTGGDVLDVEEGSSVTQIYKDNNLIASVNSLGIEEIKYLNKDDAVIDEGSLWTVQKTLTGYILEQTDLTTQETVSTTVELSNLSTVRFVRNTHKIICVMNNGSVIIDGQEYLNEDMQQYLANMSGELAAVEINGKIYFGYNNPSGVLPETPTQELNFTIPDGTMGWSLRAAMDDAGADQDKGYVINITIPANALIGAGDNGYALDLVTNIAYPINHNINIDIGAGAIVSGKGGNGGTTRFSSNPSNQGKGENGTTAIYAGSNIAITGNGRIQGGGGGGGGQSRNVSYYTTSHPADAQQAYGGGGGAGIPAGQEGGASGASGGAYYTENRPGHAGNTNGGGSPGGGNGYGGSAGQPGNNGGNTLPSFTTGWVLGGEGGTNGNALRLQKPAIYTIANTITLLGGIVEV